jgi:putative addiction module CopG family antidote
VKITLPEALETLLKEKLRSGRYADESGVMRDALRALAWRDDYESPALEAALLEGMRSPHRPYGKSTLEHIRKAARRK